MLVSQWLIERIWIGSKRQCFYKTVIKFHNIHRTAKLWTTVTICWNIWHWWNDGWSQLSEMSRLQFPSSVHLLCVCQHDPITFQSFPCKMLVNQILYICRHFHSFQSNRTQISKWPLSCIKGATHPMSNYLPIIPLQNFGLPYFLYVRTSSIQINDIKR